MKRWALFIFLISLVAILSLYLFLVDQTDMYIPDVADPAVVYGEACARCHGESGQGGGILYPGLSGNRDSPDEVQHIVRNGASFMPAFPNIPDTVLVRLAEYVARKKYLQRDHGDL